MKSTFAVTVLSSTFALAAFDANWGQEANDEVPAADLASNAVSWIGPSATAKSGKKYTSGGEVAWKLTQEGGDAQELVLFETTHATVDGTEGIGTDVVTLMTCIPAEFPADTGLDCIVQTHSYDDTTESHSSIIQTYWRDGQDALTAFPVEQSDQKMFAWIPISCAAAQQACLWEQQTAAEIRQPGVEASGKRWKYALQDDWLVTAGHYGASTMKAIFKWKWEIESDADKVALNELKAEGWSDAGKQYIQIESQINGQAEYETQELAIDIKTKAESAAGEEDSALSFGAAAGAATIAISALAF